jgi:hypothetical protein
LQVTLTEGLGSLAGGVVEVANPVRSAGAVRENLSDPEWLSETLGSTALVKLLVDCGLSELSNYRSRTLLFACYDNLTRGSGSFTLADLAAQLDASTPDGDANLAMETEAEAGAWRRFIDNQGGVAAPDNAMEAMAAHVASTLVGTRWVLEQTEAFCAANNKTLMVVLSHSEQGIRSELQGLPRWDAVLLDYLRERPHPVVDLRDFHKADYETMGCKEDVYLNRHFIGHYSPAGNFACASALLGPVLKWLGAAVPPAYAALDIGQRQLVANL